MSSDPSTTGVLKRLEALLDRQIAEAEAWPADPDGKQALRRTNTLAALTKVAVALRKLAQLEAAPAPAPRQAKPRAAPARTATPNPSDETEMDDALPPDPARLEQLRRQVEAQLERLARHLETKRATGADEPSGPGGGDAQLDGSGPSGPAPA